MSNSDEKEDKRKRLLIKGTVTPAEEREEEREGKSDEENDKTRGSH
jgi:hypothetical protein